MSVKFGFCDGIVEMEKLQITKVVHNYCENFCIY